MPDAGIYSLTSLIIGMVSAVATGPIGGIDLPEGSFEDTISDRPFGYHADVALADGTPAGYVQSSTPLPVQLDKLPDQFINAVLAIEDRRFREHDGVDPFALVTAAAETIGGDARGGSTITQQMIKNTAIGSAPTIERKMREAILSVRTHSAVSRERIFETYLQTAWFGRGQTGVMRAPEVWFGRDWEALTLGESAFLAGLLKGPYAYDPTRNPERATQRRDLVIERMQANGWITQEEARAARAEPLEVIAHVRKNDGNRWVESLAASTIARAGIGQQVGRVSDRLRVTTTVEPQWQQLATDALRRGLHERAPHSPLGRLPDEIRSRVAGPAIETRNLADDDAAALAQAIRTHAVTASPAGRVALLGRDGGGWVGAHLDAQGALDIVAVEIGAGNYSAATGHILLERELRTDAVVAGAIPDIQGAAVVLDPRDGRVLASVGGYDQRLTSFDRTRQARRQPGSAIKAFLYAAALDSGYRFDTLVDNHERTYYDSGGVPWRPRNYDRSQTGAIPLYTGLERSSNLAAASLMNLIGADTMARVAEGAGVYEDGGMRRVLAASLGSSETTLERLTSGYGTLVNAGVARQPNGVAEIRNPSDPGAPDLWAATRDLQHSSIPITMAVTNDVITAMMRGVVTRGTAARAFRGHPVTIVGKTGTSQRHADAWFVGVTPHLAVGVWIGRDDNRPMGSGFVGGRAAAPVVADLLERAHAAGLVSEDGYRDARSGARVGWPPYPFGTQQQTRNEWHDPGAGGQGGAPTTGQQRSNSGARTSGAYIGSGGLY